MFNPLPHEHIGEHPPNGHIELTIGTGQCVGRTNGDHIEDPTEIRYSSFVYVCAYVCLCLQIFFICSTFAYALYLLLHSSETVEGGIVFMVICFVVELPLLCISYSEMKGDQEKEERELLENSTGETV